MGTFETLDTSVLYHNCQPGWPVTWYLPVVHDIEIIVFLNSDQDILVRCTKYRNMQQITSKHSVRYMCDFRVT